MRIDYNIDWTWVSVIIGVIAISLFIHYKFPMEMDKCIELMGDEKIAILQSNRDIKYFERDSSGKYVSSNNDSESIEFADENKTILKLNGSSVKFYVKSNKYPNIFTLKRDITN